MTDWAILLDGQSPYVQIRYATKERAERELAMLLKYFPANHAWRKRLGVAPYAFGPTAKEER